MSPTGNTRLATFAMGTRWELLISEDAPHAQAAGEACIEAIESLHARWSRFERSSLVASINRAMGGWTSVDAETYAVLMIAERYRERTADAFACAHDIDGAAVAIERSDRGVRLPEGATLDLGAIAKGAALDAGAEILDEAEVARALVHGGTSAVLAIGGLWRVQVADATGAAGPTLELHNEVLAVSCSTPSHRDEAHLIDRRTGAQHAEATVAAIVAPLGHAAHADALATCTALLGDAPSDLVAAIGARALVWSGGAWQDALLEDPA